MTCRDSCEPRMITSIEPLRGSTALLLLRFALPLAPVPRLQCSHASLAYIGILLEERRKRIGVDDGRELHALGLAVFALAIGGSY